MAKSVESTIVNEYYYIESAPSRELASFLIVILPFSRVHSVCISCAIQLFLCTRSSKNSVTSVFCR